MNAEDAEGIRSNNERAGHGARLVPFRRVSAPYFTNSIFLMALYGLPLTPFASKR